jgi:hypothetical protein
MLDAGSILEVCSAPAMYADLIPSTCLGGEPPQMTGGTVEDGIYVLASDDGYGTCVAGTPTQATWVICGSTWSVTQWTTDNDGGGVTKFNAIYYAGWDQTEAIIRLQCGRGALPTSPVTYWFTASPGKLVLMTQWSAGTWDVAKFVKQ